MEGLGKYCGPVERLQEAWKTQAVLELTWLVCCLLGRLLLGWLFGIGWLVSLSLARKIGRLFFS